MSFPLYYYDEVKSENIQLFDIEEDKHSNISQSFIKKINEKYNICVDEATVFNYVYGILHSNDYKKTFESDLKKSLPRIPLVNSYEQFLAFSKAGKKLADLHLNYEKVEPYTKCRIMVYPEANYNVTKMKFGKNKNKSVIEYNEKITITDIPDKAYEYVISGKSAIEWIMERYAIATDSKSGIVNNPNDWCKEINDDMYIYNLLLRIINVSVKTVDIVNSLPRLEFE